MRKVVRIHPMLLGLAEAKLNDKEDDYLNGLNRKGRRAMTSMARKAQNAAVVKREREALRWAKANPLVSHAG